VARGTYQLVKNFTLACAHRVAGAGKCARLHGHNYRISFCVEGSELDQHDMLIDFRDVKHDLEQRYDHRLLNEFVEFDPERGGVHPTTERIAEVFYQRIAKLCAAKSNRPRVRWVKVVETDEAYAIYQPIEEENTWRNSPI
jgi:6-pyruvoyltetrahydropterin/6-carboxytetrahydropterin synthase